MKGGIATFVEEMALACHDLGQKVEVWAPRGATPFASRFPYPVHRVPLRGSHDLSCQFKMGREIIRHRRRLRGSIMYLAEPGPLLAMMYLQFFHAFRPARLLLTFHGSEVQRFAAGRASRPLISRLIGAADRVSTPSNFTRNLLFEHFPAARGKTVVTPGAPRAGFCTRDVPQIRTSDKVVLVTVGRLHPRKGQRRVIEALSALPPQTAQKVEYWIVGRSMRGGYEAELRQHARQCPVPVTFFGNIDNDDLELIYGRADIFAMTSLTAGKSLEGFGIAYLEASSFGLPVIGHKIGGVAEAVRHGETGLLVSPDDTAGLTAAIEKLVLDRDLRAQLGANGRIWARSHTWRDSAQTLIDGIGAAPRRSGPARGVLQPA